MIFNAVSANPCIDLAFMTKIGFVPVSFLFLLWCKVALHIIDSWSLAHFSPFTLWWILCRRFWNLFRRRRICEIQTKKIITKQATTTLAGRLLKVILLVCCLMWINIIFKDV